MIKRIYVASGYPNRKKIENEIYPKLEENDFEITYKWTKNEEEESSEFVEECRKLFNDSTLEYKQCCALRDAYGVINADALIYISRGKFGSHTEIGIAVGKLLSLAWSESRIRIYFVGDISKDSCIFYDLPFIKHFKTLNECIEHMKNYNLEYAFDDMK